MPNERAPTFLTATERRLYSTNEGECSTLTDMEEMEDAACDSTLDKKLLGSADAPSSHDEQPMANRQSLVQQNGGKRYSTIVVVKNQGVNSVSNKMIGSSDSEKDIHNRTMEVQKKY